ADSGAADVRSLVIHDDARQLPVIGGAATEADERLESTQWPIANGSLTARIASPVERVTTADRLVLLLPVLMWVFAELVTWLLVTRLLIRPLKQLQRAVIRYQPGEEELRLPRKLGPSTEIEGNRGIALRPLLAELAAELRAGAPDPARKLMIDLDLQSVNTTQDVAVAVAFLITEMVEYAMLNRPEDAVEISLRRTSELTARLTVGSPVLVPEEADQPEKMQFERIIAGLAKQLRSTLDRKLGRYSVDLPVFPPS